MDKQKENTNELIGLLVAIAAFPFTAVGTVWGFVSFYFSRAKNMTAGAIMFKFHKEEFDAAVQEMMSKQLGGEVDDFQILSVEETNNETKSNKEEK